MSDTNRRNETIRQRIFWQCSSLVKQSSCSFLSADVVSRQANPKRVVVLSSLASVISFGRSTRLSRLFKRTLSSFSHTLLFQLKRCTTPLSKHQFIIFFASLFKLKVKCNKNEQSKKKRTTKWLTIRHLET